MKRARLLEFRPVESPGRLRHYAIIWARCPETGRSLIDEWLHTEPPNELDNFWCGDCGEIHLLEVLGDARRGEPLQAEVTRTVEGLVIRIEIPSGAPRVESTPNSLWLPKA